MSKKNDSDGVAVWQQLNEKCDEIIKIVEKKKRKGKTKNKATSLVATTK